MGRESSLRSNTKTLNSVQSHKSLPEGSFKCRWEAEWLRLLPRKKRAYPQNVELRLNYRHLLWSKYARVFYERVIEEKTLDENLRYYRKTGILYLYPTGGTIEEIREEMAKEGLTYLELMFRREQERLWWEANQRKPTGNGDEFWKRTHKDNFQKYLKQKK